MLVVTALLHCNEASFLACVCSLRCVLRSPRAVLAVLEPRIAWNAIRSRRWAKRAITPCGRRGWVSVSRACHLRSVLPARSQLQSPWRLRKVHTAWLEARDYKPGSRETRQSHSLKNSKRKRMLTSSEINT